MDKKELERRLAEAEEKKETLEMEMKLKQLEKENMEKENELHPSGLRKMANVIVKADRKMVDFSAKHHGKAKTIAKEMMKDIQAPDYDPKKRATKLMWG
jgi:hypothetical protein